MEGWRGWIGTTAVPRSTSGSSRPTIASTVRVSGPKICDDHIEVKPISRSLVARTSVRSSGPSASSPIPMRMSPSPLDDL